MEIQTMSAKTCLLAVGILIIASAALLVCRPNEVEGQNGDAQRDFLQSPTGVPRKLTSPVHNTSGTEIPVAQFRFLFQASLNHDEDQSIYSRRVLVGLQANTNYYYIWLQRTQWAPYVLYCHGQLRNQSGTDVPVDTLKFALAADLDGDGSSEIVGLQSNTTWMYAWNLAQCNNGIRGDINEGDATGSALYRELFPTWNGKNWNGNLVNRTGTLIPVNELKYVLAGHFTGPGSGNAAADQIRALHNNNAYHYVWSLHPSGQVDNWYWRLAGDGFLKDASGRDVSVNHIRYVLENRVDETNSNWGADKHELIAYVDDPASASDGSVLVWEDQDVAIRQFPVCKNSSSSCANRILVFSLDQGALNGLVANADNPSFDTAFSRVIATLQRFRAKFNVHVLLNPNIRQNLKGRLVKVLDRLQAAGVPFLFDIYASDINSMCVSQPKFSQCFRTFSASDARVGYVSIQKHPSGDATNSQYIDFYAARYGSIFAGVRIFEILSLHWTEWAESNCKGNHPAFWAYNPTLVRDIISFARSYSKFVFFTDNKWYNPYERYLLPCNTWPPINKVRNDIVSVARRFPQVIYLGFSNNEGVRDHPDGYYPHNYRLKNWHSRISSVAHLRGRGLSNQTWLTDAHRLLFDETLPPKELTIWVSDAYQKGIAFVQLEPFYYLFKWDRHYLADWVTEKDLESTTWLDAGSPTDEMRIVAEILGVDLSGI